MEREEEETCSACGSADIECIEWSGPSGVTSPDGGEETWRALVKRCKGCGAREEISPKPRVKSAGAAIDAEVEDR